MGTPRVSVLIPVHNGERFIAGAVESALGQKFEELEVLVVDDGSRDETSRVLESFGERIRRFSQPQRGAYAARNFGLGEARGEFIAFLDADDRWHRDKLQKQIPLLESDPEIGLVFSNGLIVREGEKNPMADFFRLGAPARGRVFPSLVRRNFIPQSSVVVRKQCFQALGPFLEIKMGADYHKWMQISRVYKLDYREEPLFTYTIHGENLSSDWAGRYRDFLLLFDDLIRTAEDPRAVSLLRKRRLELEYEFGLRCLREGTGFVWSGIWKRKEGINLGGRCASLLRVLGGRLAAPFRRRER